MVANVGRLCFLYLLLAFGFLLSCVLRCVHRRHQMHNEERQTIDTDTVMTKAFADGHTVSNAPDLFRPPKLSGTGPG